MTDNVTKNLQQLMETLKITGRELARQCGITYSTVQRMLAGVNNDHRVSTIIPVCKTFKISSDELIGLKPLSPKFFTGKTVVNHFEFFLPLISQEDALTWDNVVSKSYPNDWNVWYRSDSKCSKNAFAMVVSDNKNAPIIPEGSTLIIDSIFNLEQDIFVLVKTKGYNNASIRKILIEEPQVYLQPLNTQLPPNPLNENQIIIGKIIQIKVNYES